MNSNAIFLLRAVFWWMWPVMWALARRRYACLGGLTWARDEAAMTNAQLWVNSHDQSHPTIRWDSSAFSFVAVQFHF